MSKPANPVDAVLDRMVVAVIGENADFVSHADVLGIPPETIKTWRRRGEVPMARLKQFAEDWKVPLDKLLHGGRAEVEGGIYHATRRLPDDFVLVPRHDVQAGAGGGALIHDESVVDHLAFKRRWIHSLGLDPRQISLIEVNGDSMQPTLRNGDLILVDRRKEDVCRAGVYVIHFGGHLYAKRLAPRLDGGVDVISDNPAYGVEHLSREAAEALTVVGRVVWSGGKI